MRVEAVRLVRQSGVFTGEMDDEPLSGKEKARRVRAVAEQEKLDLTLSHAYGDSISDLQFLESVGRPAVVNPDGRLRGVARARDWPALTFSLDPDDIERGHDSTRP